MSGGPAVRWPVDGAADDARWVHLATRVAIGFAALPALTGALTLAEAAASPHKWLVGLALLLPSLLMAQRLWALRRGRPVPLLHRLLALGWKLVLLAAAAHFLFHWYRVGAFSALNWDEVGPAGLGYLGCAVALGVLTSACTRQQRLQAVVAGGALRQPVNLLDRRAPISAKARARVVLPPVRRWPGILAWYGVGAALYAVAGFVALVLVLVTKGLSYLIPMPSLLALLGPRVTRPLFERASRSAYMARRHASLDARGLLAADPRPPVLLLRSFADDNRVLPSGDAPGWAGHGARTFEEMITQRLKPFGPVVAIGRPGEEVPSAGAAREYLADDAWQARVEELVEQALAIVVIAGKTPNLGWELQRIESLDAMHKLLMLVPAHGAGEAAERLVTLAQTLRETRIGASIHDHLHTDAAAVYIGERGVVELASSRRLPRDYAVAIDVGMELLLQERARRAPAAAESLACR